MKTILTLVCIIAVTAVFSQRDTSRLQRITRARFKINYPASWTIDTSGLIGTELFVFSPLENENDKFRENINVLIQQLPDASFDLNEYKKTTETQIAKVTGGKVYESAKVKGSQGEFYKVTYAMTQGQFNLKVISYCYIQHQKAYLVTFTAESAKYDQYSKRALEILNSFSLTK